MSDLIRWEKKFKVGNSRIDSQHRKLFHLVNELYKAMQRGEAQERLDVILDELARYTDYHFRDEEGIFNATAYPEKENHCAFHRELIEKVQDLQKRRASGEILITVETLEFLKDWVSRHIMKTDQGLRPYIQIDDAGDTEAVESRD